MRSYSDKRVQSTAEIKLNFDIKTSPRLFRIRNELTANFRSEIGITDDPQWCHWGFFPVAIDGTMCPGVDSASKNEYQENVWG
jgi:hypothetical protein